MKHYISQFFFCFYLLSAFFVHAQNSNCTQAIPDYIFQQKRNQIGSAYQDATKLSQAKNLVRNNCLSSAQIQELASLFIEDEARLDFTEFAYDFVLDPDQYYDVYNSFAYFSNVFRLHDYILAKKGWGPGNGNTTIPPVQYPGNTTQYPNYNYPDYFVYQGDRHCSLPISETRFQSLYQEVERLTSETDRKYRLNNRVDNACLATAQIMKLSALLNSEVNRLEYLKQAYSQVYDIGNYSSAIQVLTYGPYRKQFREYLFSNPVNTPENPPCQVSNSEFQDIKKRIQGEAFSNSKLSLAKNIVRSKKCFSVSQITSIVKLMNFSSAKMDFAKFAYDYTYEKEEYYKVADGFTFSTDREKLLAFIESKR